MEISLPKRIYYVESLGDLTVCVAMDVKVLDDRITWFDTVKDRGMHIEKVIDSNPGHFVFIRKGAEHPQTYTFLPMTLELYEAKVKPHLINGSDFETIEDLEAAFEATKNDAW